MMYSLNRTWTWLFWSATPISGWTGGGHADDGILGCRWNSYVWLLFLIGTSLHFCICFLVEHISCLSLLDSFCVGIPICCIFLWWCSYFVVPFLWWLSYLVVQDLPLWKSHQKSHWNSWNFNNKSLLFRSNPWSFMVDLRKAWWAPWQPWEPWELRWKEPWHALDMAAMVLLWEMQS
jgi:hypothetical protein